ncbi:superoxide dismutase [Patescibacteria group bacterium]|jgi:Fe-Mn family superoxide dismutase|nr:superoxide dismutase [Patescibacteria group bacterium]
MLKSYEAKTFALGALDGLSETQISEHLKLYQGYVKNSNALLQKIEQHKQNAEAMAIELSELVRRFGFEFNGMRLHEYYFSQFEKAEGSNDALKMALESQYGSFDAWKNQISAMAVMRGIGWVLLVQDETNGNLLSVWVSDHELGQLGGQKILFALDVWEHAYTVDYKPTERAKYVEAFWKNLNWQKVEERYR